MRTLTLFLSLALSASLYGQTEPGIAVPVWTPAGMALSAQNLQVSASGVPVKVLDVNGPEDDLMLLVVLDLAGDLSLVDTARQALIGRIRGLPANRYVAVLRSQDGLRVLVDPTADREAVSAAIRSYPVGGKAGLLNTVQTAAELGHRILTRSGVRLAVLYVTDSDIQNYREDYTNPVVNMSDQRDLSRRFSDGLVRERVSKLVAALTSVQTPVFIVHLNYRTDGLNEAYQTGLLELAAATGGTVRFCRTLAEIPAAVDQVVDGILSHWSVRVSVPEAQRQQVDLTLETGQGEALRYRSRYVIRRP